MKSISLLRHGDAPQNPKGDLYRELSDKGVEEIKQLSKLLLNKKITFDLIVTSPIKRAKDTVNIILDLQSHTPEIEYYEPLYTGNLKQINNFIQSLNDKYTNILIVGHNPLISSFASNISFDQQPISLKTGMLLNFKLNINNWHESISGSGNIELIIDPQK